MAPPTSLWPESTLTPPELAPYTTATDSALNIIGVGAQLTAFVHAFFSTIAAALAVADGKINKSEAEWAFDLFQGNMLFFVAAAITTIAQFESLSPSNVLLVLQLTWVLEGPLILSYSIVNWAVKKALPHLSNDHFDLPLL
ncbi:unnamed protein product [Cyclocybe aegerita]|uniref:Uncharacterized protein n=1 Tax=Cyclocybe aegerita TaxID=1973307 RepID=A0A8S0W1B5_CYCAE|nr:unnamed protein product [Cyclocybe aegerita]